MTHPQTHLFFRLRALLFNTIALALLGILVISYQSWAAALRAETPTEPTAINHVISYQGTLTNELGQPIVETLPMTFRLYESTDAPLPLWTETYSDTNSVVVQNGQFQVWLGALEPFPANLWSHSALYLGIQIDNDEEMQPRERLATTPFAIQADSANSLPDRSVTSAKLALQQEVQRFDPTIEMSATATISQGIGSEIPGTELLLNLASDSRILYTAQAVATFSDEAAVHTIQLIVDGVVMQQYQSAGQTIDTISLVSYLDLAAGEHRITLNYLASAESQLQIVNTPTPGYVSYLVVDQP